MEPLRHSLVWCALASVAAVGAPVGGARAETSCAALRAAAAESGPPAAREGPAPAPAEPIATAASVAAELSAGGDPDAAAGAPVAAVPAKALAAPRPALPPAPDDGSGRGPPAAAGVRKVEIALPLEIAVHGRVLVDLSADERNAWGRELSMSSARLGFEAKIGDVKTVVDADLASNPLVQDAYVRIDLPRTARVTAGRFKAPFSERRLESSWTLPVVDRGLVDHYLVKRNGLGGRRLGLAGALRPWDGRLEASGGIFAGDPTALAAASDAGEDWAARVAYRATGALEVGASGYRAGAGSGPGAVPARWATGAFANVDLGPFEAEVEGFAGRLAEGSFTAGTALVGWRFRAGERRRLRLTPVAGAEALQLSGATRGVGYGAIAGAVISWTEGLKVKLQGEWARRPGDAAAATAVAAEVGTRF